MTAAIPRPLTIRQRVSKILRQLNLFDLYRFLKYGKEPEVFHTVSPDLLIALHHCFLKASSLDILSHSDYMEYGIYHGFAFWYAQSLAKDLELDDLRFFGFDSFQGLPEIVGKDQGGDFAAGMYSSGREFVEKNLNQYGVDWTNTHLVEGFYSDTLNENTKKEYQFRKCSILVIDCDLYEATREVLTFVGSLLNEQAFIIFDDWNCYNADPEKGERKAFAEFLQQNPTIKATPHKQFGSNCQVFFLEKVTTAAG
jgi:O-methyltransferase